MKKNFFTIKLIFYISILIQGICYADNIDNHPKDMLDLSSIEILDLKTGCRIALSGNPSIETAKARINQARQKVLQTRALYWPSLDVNSSADRIRLSDHAYEENLLSAQRFDPQADIKDPENYYQADVTATWVLFSGFERRFKNLAAKYGKEASQYACQDLKRMLVFSICESYYSIQFAKEKIKIAQADKAFNLRLLSVAQARRNAGIGSLSDELNFIVRVNSAEAELIKANHQYEANKYGLAALLGIPGAILPVHIKLKQLTDETLDELIPPEPGPQIEYAIKNRPDVLQKEYLLKKIVSEIEIARAQFYPDVYLTASVDGEHLHNARFENDDFGRSIGIMFKYNFFSGGSSLAEIREKKAAMVEAKKSLDYLNLKVKADIRSTVTEIKSAQKQVVLLRSNEILFRRNRDLAEKEYKAGQGSLVHLNETQRDLVSARGNFFQVVVSLRLAWQKLYMVSGKILKIYSNGIES